MDRQIRKIISKLNKKEPKISDEQRLQARQDLIKISSKQVTRRLEASLYSKIRIDLRREHLRQNVGKGHLAHTQEIVSEHFIKLKFRVLKGTKTDQIVTTNKSILELFKKEGIQGRILILGKQGSGKTHELLLLAKELLTQARQSLSKPIPVIFELSEWNAEQDLSDWLSQQLLNKYSIPVNVSQYWIEQKQLLPLLDGLDERKKVYESLDFSAKELNEKQEELIFECIRGIDHFLAKYSIPLVVCCRHKKYKEAESKFIYFKHLNAEIQLQPLDDDQIHYYLRNLNQNELWCSIQSQSELMEFARSPFFLIMLVVTFQGSTIKNTDELLDGYIHKQLSDINSQGAYSPGSTLHPNRTRYYLSWLARNLETNQKIEFLIEDLQPSWIESVYFKRFYVCMSGLGGSLIFGLLGFNIWLFEQPIGWLIFGLAFGLIFGLISGRRDINLTEKRTFSWLQFRREVWRTKVSGGIGGLIIGLVAALISDPIRGGISGLTFCFCLMLFSGLFSGLKTAQLDVKDKIYPNQGIKDSIKNIIIFGLIFGLLPGIMFLVCIGLIKGLPIAFKPGILGFFFGAQIGFLKAGIFSVYKHTILRCILYQSGVSPWDYARFLEHAENHRFIHRIGGRYRFFHDSIKNKFWHYSLTRKYQFIQPKYQLMFRKIRRAFGSKIFKILIIVIVVCWGAVSIQEKSPKTIRELVVILFEKAESIAIASAAFVFMIESSDRKKRDHYEAWQVINSAINQNSSGGRIQALEDLNSDGVDLEGLSAQEADLSGIDLSSSKLNRANLKGTQLDGSELKYASLEEANLYEANLYGANLYGANLSNAVLTQADLSNSALNCTNLSHASLDKTILDRAKLQSAILDGARLNDAILSEANLQGANLAGANLAGANLDGANLDGANLDHIKWSHTTRWPENKRLSRASNIPDTLKQELGLTTSYLTKS